MQKSHYPCKPPRWRDSNAMGLYNGSDYSVDGIDAPNTGVHSLGI